MNQLVELARQAIQTYVTERKKIAVPADFPKEYLEQKAGIFVSLHQEKELRGCIGTIYPVRENVAEEIIANAISAATSDPRFNPVTLEELAGLEVKVDVLSPPEKTDRSGLNPKKYGVIVQEGDRLGVLLPDLDGVDSVDQQIQIAADKAGLDLGSGHCELYRFTVDRNEE